jgi:predicted MFS family arabinose efflux permease
MFFLGGFLSGYLFSYLTSKLGRRSVLILILSMVVGSILLCAFATNFKMFLVGYFFVGFTFFGYETSIYIYIG